jgi:hypothetical protein
MANNQKEELQRWINLARSPVSCPEEQREDWQEWVTRPVIKTALAPRQARAALEILGYCANRGYPIADILQSLFEKLPCSTKEAQRDWKEDVD